MIFGDWECFHSIREQILCWLWCSKNVITFPKNMFSNDPKMGTSFFFGEISNPYNFFKVSIFLTNLRFRLKNHVPIFRSIEKINFRKVIKFFEHQCQRKICSRIELKHSQSPKITLKHSSRVCAFYFVLYLKNPWYRDRGSEILCTPKVIGTGKNTHWEIPKYYIASHCTAKFPGTSEVFRR